jgi:hypothetical protein
MHSTELDETDSRPLHPIERLLGNPWLLMTIAVLLPALSYATWGFIELQNLR